MPRRALALIAVALLASCGDAPERTLDIALIERAGDRDAADALTLATAQGLVRLDAAGQPAPALAESWTLTRDGRSAIFRLRADHWPDGRPVRAREVVTSLRAAIRTAERKRPGPLFSAIDAIVPMTDRVVEIRLKAPRPHLLELLAQPELAIRRGSQGTGPFRAQVVGGQLRLNAVDMLPGLPARPLAIQQLRPALAVTRFADGVAALVLGGRFSDWPLIPAADLPRAAVRTDPAMGLLGLGFVRSTRFDDPGIRTALAMAIDRAALQAAFAESGWTAIERLLPAQLDSGAQPAAPAWTLQPLEQRRIEAANRVRTWQARGGAVTVTVALPDGPGARLLFDHLRADWGRIGITVRRTAARQDADLVLIDELAPNSSANWYLTRTGCDGGWVCSQAGHRALIAARQAPTLQQRSEAMAVADTEAVRVAGYIPLARPVRWSLVAPALKGFRENAAAAHPLDELQTR